jgi:hypothetical protein
MKVGEDNAVEIGHLFRRNLGNKCTNGVKEIDALCLEGLRGLGDLWRETGSVGGSEFGWSETGTIAHDIEIECHALKGDKKACIGLTAFRESTGLDPNLIEDKDGDNLTLDKGWVNGLLLLLVLLGLVLRRLLLLQPCTKNLCTLKGVEFWFNAKQL